MFPFRFRWLRSTVRKITPEIPVDKAQLWRSRLSKAYLFLAINITGLIIYQSYVQDLDMYGKDSKNMTKIEKYKRLAKGQEVEVIEIKGLSVVNKYNIPGEKTEKT